MKKLTATFLLLMLLTVLAACSEIGVGKESSYSVTIRNGGSGAVTLKSVTVNGTAYLNQDMQLAAADAAGNSDYLLLLTSGQTIRVNAVIYDPALAKETEIAEKFIDNAGEGYAILVEYNAGKVNTATSTVGRLSAWGSE